MVDTANGNAETRQTPAKADKLRLLHQTEPDTPMGQLLRAFWQPVACSDDVAPGRAILIRIMGEQFTLYRGESGRAHLIAARCAHRQLLLHTGWVEADSIRCMYHGWRYGGDGACLERPAEADSDGVTGVRIGGFPVEEYAGLVFAYLGEGEPPEFDLPRKAAFEETDRLVFSGKQFWPCNWFQQVENSMDAVHVSFVHHWGKVGTFGQAVDTTLPELSYEETSAGIRQTAVRSASSRRVSEWTFPNNNYIVTPSFGADAPWIDNGVWVVPVDDSSSIRFSIRSVPMTDEATDTRVREYFSEHGDYQPSDNHDALLRGENLPADEVLSLTNAQDYIAQVGQGTVVDRTVERLGRSDMGIAFLRRLFWRELDAIVQGREPKRWRRQAGQVPLPRQTVS